MRLNEIVIPFTGNKNKTTQQPDAQAGTGIAIMPTKDNWVVYDGSTKEKYAIEDDYRSAVAKYRELTKQGINVVVTQGDVYNTLKRRGTQ